jgi:hypothetical protein
LGAALAAATATIAFAVGCTPTPNSQADAESTIRSARSTDLASRERIERLLDSPAAAPAAARVLASNAGGDARLFATYVYVNTGTDPAPLRPLLKAADPSTRLLAGTGLVARGDPAGFDVLVEGLGHTEPMLASRTPLRLWVFAALMLARYTGVAENGPPLDADPAQVAAGQARWKTWLTANRSRLHYDSAAHIWSLQ